MTGPGLPDVPRLLLFGTSLPRAIPRWGARRRYDRWFRARRSPRAPLRLLVCARADAARTTPHRVRALAARSSAALAGVMVDKPKSGRCGVTAAASVTRHERADFPSPDFHVSSARLRHSAFSLVRSLRASPAHAGARTHLLGFDRTAHAHVAQQVADMPTTHVLVALSSVAFTAASGHTLRAIRERRDPAYARRVRARRQTGVATRRTPNARGASVTPHASPEIEALRACPPWHEEG